MASRTLTASITLPKLQSTAALKVSARVSAAITLPKLQASATMSLNRPKVVDAAITLPKLQATAALKVSARVSAAIDLPALQASATMSLNRPQMVDAAIVLPALQVAVTLKVRHFASMSLLWELSRRVEMQALSLRYWMVARDVAQVRTVGYALSQPMRWQGAIAWDGPRKPVQLGVVYGLRLAQTQRLAWRFPVTAALGVRYGARTVLDWIAPWGAAQVVRAQAGMVWGAAPAVRAQAGMVWGAAPAVRAQAGMVWGAAPAVRAQAGMVWGAAPAVRAQAGMVWGATGGQRVALAVGYSMSVAGPRRVHGFAAPLNDRFRLHCHWATTWALPDASAPSSSGQVVPVPAVTLEAGGRSVRFLGGLSLAQDVRDGLWRLQATVAQPVARGEAVACAMGPNVWHLMATEHSIERADVLADGYRLVAASAPALWADTPIGQLLGRAAWHTGQASELARALAAPASLAWDLPDVVLPAPLVHEALWGLSRWQAVQRLARACGGWALVSPNGTAITCRSAGAAQGRHTPLEASWRELDPVAVVVANRDIADGIADDPARPSPAGGAVRHLLVRPVPWRGVVLRATAPATLSVPVQTDVVETETIDLTAGVGQLSRPVDALLSADVWPSSAGPLRWQPDTAGVWLDAPAHATARVRYSSRALAVSATSPTLTPTLITLEDATP
ncbi:MAG: hypothetical protein Q8Q84_22685 [Hydrogenophaga sp.]|nr:hypothetical protein [Hydrogenophaga sp.]